MFRARLLASLAAILATHPISAQELVYELEGTTPPGFDFQPNFGYPILVVDDLDGDGQRDFLVTDGSYPVLPLFSVGRVYAYSGASGNEIYHVDGEGENDTFGRVLTEMGDVNGDGVRDWAAADRNRDSTTSYIAFPGRINVHSGVDGQRLYQILPTTGDAFLGAGMTGIADVDGDGVEDLLALAPYANVSSTNMGEAYVFSGFTGSLIRTHTGYSEQVFEEIGLFGGWNGGQSVGAVGDVDGDGVGDYGTGAPAGRNHLGLVQIWSGATGNLIHQISGQQIHLFWGLGTSIVGLGDVNGDQRSDFALGDFGYLNGVGRALVLSGIDGSELYSISNPGFPGLGVNIKASGDWNGDGRRELLAITDSVVGIYDRIDGSLVDFIQTPETITNTLTAVDGDIDIDGDGRSELLMGLRHPQGQAQGVVRAYSKENFFGESFCLGNTLFAGCPCLNVGQAGCANSTGLGAALDSDGGPDTAPAELSFQTFFLPTPSTVILFAGTSKTPGGFGLPLGDGLLCVAGSLQRLETRQTNGIDNTFFGPNLPGLANWQPGEERTFQVWYRDNSGPCGSGSNTTNALRHFMLPR